MQALLLVFFCSKIFYSTSTSIRGEMVADKTMPLAMHHPNSTEKERRAAQLALRSASFRWGLAVTSVGAVGFTVCCGSGFGVLQKSALWALMTVGLSLAWFRLVWQPGHNTRRLVADGRLLWLTGEVRRTYEQRVVALDHIMPMEVRLEVFRQLQTAQHNQTWIDKGRAWGFTEDSFGRMMGKRDYALGQFEQLTGAYINPP